MISAVMLFAGGVILARWLGPESLGVYSVVLSLASLASLPITSGLPTLVTRETAKAFDSGEHGIIRGLWRFALGLVLASLLLAAILLVITSSLQEDSARVPFSYLAIGFLLVPLMGLDLLRGSAMQGLGSGVWSQMPDALVRPAVFLILLVLGTQVVSGDHLVYGLAANACAAALSFFVGTILLRRITSGRLLPVRAEYHPRVWLRALVSLGALSATQRVLGNIDVLMLGWLGPATDVGLYKVALQGVALMVIVQSAVSAILAARFSTSFAAGDIEAIRRVSDHALLLYIAGSAVFVVAFLSFGEQFIVLFFGPRYTGAVAILTILAIGQLVNALTGPVLDILVMSGHVRPALISASVGCLLVIGSATITVPLFGAPGMAISTASGVALANLMMAASVKNCVGFDATLLGAIPRWSKGRRRRKLI
nr:oligosaccharide flippase family protein [Cryobacterium sp. TMT2-10]